MTKRIWVVPALGRTVPDPEAGDLLPAEGREVTDNSYWRRRKGDEDITVTAGKPPSTIAKAVAKPEEAK